MGTEFTLKDQSEGKARQLSGWDLRRIRGNTDQNGFLQAGLQLRVGCTSRLAWLAWLAWVLAGWD